MLISPIAPRAATTSGPIPAPTTREQVAQALVAVPSAAIMIATFGAMTPTETSRADMLAPMFAKLDIATAAGVLDAAIAGVLTLAPEFASKEASLRQAAAGVITLLTEAAADHKMGSSSDIAQSIIGPMTAVAAPLFEIATLLKPAPAN